MNPERENNFDQTMKQLMVLLKKLLKNMPSQDSLSQLSPFLKDSGINLNLCFFTFLPLAPEELDELEEIYDQYFFREEKNVEELSGKLSPDDLDFLRRNGILF